MHSAFEKGKSLGDSQRDDLTILRILYLEIKQLVGLFWGGEQVL